MSDRVQNFLRIMIAFCFLVALVLGVVSVASLARGGGPEAPRQAALPAAPASPSPAASPSDEVDLGLRRIDSAWLDSTARSSGIPRRAVQAYVGAAATAQDSFPSCGLGWNTLAGIGFVESENGRMGGRDFDDNGTLSRPLLGPLLDGSTENTVKILDSDDGRLDQNERYDAAVGPMQFLPATWKAFGIDGNGDGIADPQNIDDSALSAARYLCYGDVDLTSAEGWTAAIRAYNNDDDYIRAVRDNAQRYAG